MDLRLEGRRALIVGGSTGIGLAAAERLAAEGAEVLIVSRRPENLRAAANRLLASTGRRPAWLAADVAADPSSAGALAAEVERRWGALDVLVCAVGGSVRGEFADLGDAEWQANYDFNILSTVRPIRALTARLADGRDPSIVAVSGAGAKMPYPHQVMSNVHKAGLLALVKTLAAELAPAGIRINAVCPGRTRTALWSNRAERLAQERGCSVDAIYEEFARDVPLGRFAEPDEIAVMIAWLASPLAGYITGQSINVDGGIARGLL